MLNPFGPHRDDRTSPRDPGGKSVVVRMEGELVIATARAAHQRLRAACKQRGVRTVVVDFAGATRIDSAGVAVIALATRSFQRRGKTLELRHLDQHHQDALALIPTEARAPEAVIEPPGFLESVGDFMLSMRDRAVQLSDLIVDIFRQGAAVVIRRKRLPAGAFVYQAVTMGADALFIVGLLAFLLGTTLAFQGAVQLSQFGASVYVADLIGVSMVREFAPMMTAIILAGRAGAAIAAELGTMRAGSEIDALEAMGLSPVRFLVLPRLGALSVMQPALTLLAMFIGICGGILVAALTLGMSPTVFVDRVIDTVTMGDVIHGLGKSLVFAWIISITGTFFGLQARGNASAVGAATTRTVVVAISCILGVDAAFATIAAAGGPS